MAGVAVTVLAVEVALALASAAVIVVEEAAVGRVNRAVMREPALAF